MTFEEEYERGFVDGMQQQMKSSVDRAVNAAAKKEWVGLTDKEIKHIDEMTLDKEDAIRLTAVALQEKNT